jgi:hypothetical protein
VAAVACRGAFLLLPVWADGERDALDPVLDQWVTLRMPIRIELARLSLCAVLGTQSRRFGGSCTCLRFFGVASVALGSVVRLVVSGFTASSSN